MTTPPHISRLLAGLDGVHVRGTGWECRCPCHEDKRQSLSIGIGDDGRALVHCHSGCQTGDIVTRLGLKLADLFPANGNGNGHHNGSRIVATYDYRDESGKLLYQVVRFEPKDFRQRRPDGAGWTWKTKGVRRVPYRLPELLKADPHAIVFLPEGEKDVDRLAALGLIATCNAGGAGKWQASYAKHFEKRRVVIIPDNDSPGREHAEAVAKSLARIAADVKILELPNLPDKGDVSDWLNNGGTAQKLLELAESTPTFEPKVRVDGYHQTDAGNAELFAALHGDRVRFDHARGRWLLWAGHSWTADNDAEIRRLAKATARERYLRAARIADRDTREAEARWAIASESKWRLDAMLTLAQAEKPIAQPGDEWDADPWLLGAKNGVIDLRTGRLRDGHPNEKITMRATVSYDPQAPCIRWARCLDEVFQNDIELIRYVWRAVGYSLTGDTSEQCLFVAYGKGSNGKTTFLAALRRAIGDYAHNMPFSTVELNQRNAIPNDVAALAGKRFVTASETNESTRLNEARIKALTGCDPVTARYLHAEWFTFRPIAKFWLAVNHRPRVNDDSHGFWRRVRLIPFQATFAGDADDKQLEKTLADEAPGILAWAVRGCLDWQRNGLIPPANVVNATETYRAESDPLAGFILERCIVEPNATAKAAELYKAYVAWAEHQGIRDRELLTATAFGRRMSDKFTKERYETGAVYEGIQLTG